MLFGEVMLDSTAVIAELIALSIPACAWKAGDRTIEGSDDCQASSVGLRVAAKQNDRDHRGQYAPG